MKIPVSAIILTRDEEQNIRRCLRCLQPFDEVILVDSGSQDRTLLWASEERPDIRVFTHPFRDFGDQRNWALDETQPANDWVLFIDADEFCTPALAREIGDFVHDPGPNAGAYVSGKNYFLGKWLKYSTYYPSFQLRLLRRGEVRFRKEGHGQREVTRGPKAYLKNSWIHDGFSKGVEQWVSRHNTYTSDEVHQIVRLRQERLVPSEFVSSDLKIRRRAMKKLSARLPGRPLLNFLYCFVFRGGFLDGYPGLLYASLRLTYDIQVAAKRAELHARPSSQTSIPGSSHRNSHR